MQSIHDLDFSKMDMPEWASGGGVIGVIQNLETGEVLNTYLLDRPAVQESLENKDVRLPTATGDRRQVRLAFELKETYVDCDADTLLLRVSAPITAKQTFTFADWVGIEGCVNYPIDLSNGYVWREKKSIAIAQHWETNEVIMVGVATNQAIRQTLNTEKATFWSRSKGRIWTKGESSGNFLQLRLARMSQDGEVVIYYVKPVGPVCHTGAQTCFREFDGSLRILR